MTTFDRCARCYSIAAITVGLLITTLPFSGQVRCSYLLFEDYFFKFDGIPAYMWIVDMNENDSWNSLKQYLVTSQSQLV